jgi:radical SAM protein with 4Fe4S-binding SPASM domain
VKVLRARAERFGAIVATESPPALVSVGRDLARRLGVDGGALWDEPSPGLDVEALSGPTEAHVAVTERCPAGCSGCYADATPTGYEPPFAEVCARLDALAAAGTFSVAFGGGEAALREDLPEIAAHARTLGMVPTVTTSGLGMTAARAARFRVFAQVNVSHDGVGAVYRSVRGYDGAPIAERAIALLREAGVPVGANTVLTRASFPHLAETAAHLESLGCVELQLLRFKPSGRGRLDYLAQRLDDAQIAAFGASLAALSRAQRIALRIDCALLPFLAGSGETTPEAVRAFGVMGCEPGRSLVAVRADGRAAPCSFWQSDARAMPDDTTRDALTHAWQRDATLEAFRDYQRALPEPCASCAFRASCRGGCRIVAGALGSTPWAPDPECPRVRAHARAHHPAQASRPARSLDGGPTT